MEQASYGRARSLFWFLFLFSQWISQPAFEDLEFITQTMDIPEVPASASAAADKEEIAGLLALGYRLLPNPNRNHQCVRTSQRLQGLHADGTLRYGDRYTYKTNIEDKSVSIRARFAWLKDHRNPIAEGYMYMIDDDEKVRPSLPATPLCLALTAVLQMIGESPSTLLNGIVASKRSLPSSSRAAGTKFLNERTRQLLEAYLPVLEAASPKRVVHESAIRSALASKLHRQQKGGKHVHFGGKSPRSSSAPTSPVSNRVALEAAETLIARHKKTMARRAAAPAAACVDCQHKVCALSLPHRGRGRVSPAL